MKNQTHSEKGYLRRKSWYPPRGRPEADFTAGYPQRLADNPSTSYGYHVQPDRQRRATGTDRLDSLEPTFDRRTARDRPTVVFPPRSGGHHLAGTRSFLHQEEGRSASSDRYTKGTCYGRDKGPLRQRQHRRRSSVARPPGGTPAPCAPPAGGSANRTRKHEDGYDDLASSDEAVQARPRSTQAGKSSGGAQLEHRRQVRPAPGSFIWKKARKNVSPE